MVWKTITYVINVQLDNLKKLKLNVGKILRIFKNNKPYDNNNKLISVQLAILSAGNISTFDPYLYNCIPST